MEPSRAWAEVDLGALAANLAALRRRVGPDVATCLVVKADAYGHGAVEVAREATAHGVDAIAVTTCAEASELRRAGVTTRLIVLSPLLESEDEPAIQAGFELCVPSEEHLRRLERGADALGRILRVHLKVDTGMGRLGIAPERALATLASIRDSRVLELAGLMSHLAAPEGALSPVTAIQAERFAAILSAARSREYLAGSAWAHLANSAGVLSGLTPLHDAVRVGAAAYGMVPDPRLATDELTPVLSVRTPVVHLSDLPRGASTGYGGTWTARRDSRLAVLPVGYADGVICRLGDRGSVLLLGQRAPIVGRISMDLTTIDVTDVRGAALGDVATLIGTDGDERISVEEVAAKAETSPYEITCSIGDRVRRIHVRGTTEIASSSERETVPV